MHTVVIKTRHCLSDDYGLLHTLVESFEKDPPTYPKVTFTQRGTLKQISFYLKFPFQAIYELAKFASLTFQDHPWKVTDQKKAWKQLFWNSPIIPVQKIKVIKNRFKVSFASVLHAACSAACRETMLSLREKNQTNSEFEEEYNSSIVSNLVLPSAIILPLPNHPKILRNHCAGVYVHLPVGHYDTIERLLECERQIIRAKNSLQPFLGKILPLIGGALTISLTGAFGPNRQLPMGISIFPISTQKVYNIYDREVVHIEVAAGAQVGVAGVNVFIRTYNEGVQFSMTAENSIMSHEHIKKTINLMVEEIDILYKMSLV